MSESDDISELVSSTNEEQSPSNRKIFCIVLTIVIIGFGGLGIWVTFMMCPNSDNEYCLCYKYAYKSDGIYDCYATISNDNNATSNNSMTCAMDTGYFLCTTYGHPSCPISGSTSGWNDCTYYESKTKNHLIYTCDTFRFGRARCFEETKSCCWYPTE